MNRHKAFLIHAGIGIAVLALLLIALVYFWYPPPYFKLAAKIQLLYIMTGICAVGAPLLTWVVFKPGKKGLKFDLWVIALLQVSALAFNVFVLWSQKPQYMVFAVDRFNIIRAGEFDRDIIEDPRFLAMPRRGPLLLIATLPSDRSEYQSLLQGFFFEGKKDLHWHEKFWTLYDENYKHVLRRALPVTQLENTNPDYHDEIARLVVSSGVQAADLLYVPILEGDQDYAIIIKKSDASVIDAIPLRAWLQ